MTTSPPATAGPRVLHPTEFFHSGPTAFFALQTDPRFSYCLYVPTAHQTAAEGLPLLVAVHGTQRTAEKYRNAHRAFAEEHGCVVLAPLFPAGIIEPEDLNSYKRIRFHDIRFDEVLLAMVEQIGRRYRVRTDRFLLQGFSGGGQFAHRFAYLHPGRLAALSVGAPGRITRIDPQTPWWLGTADIEEQFGIALDLPALRRVPVQMIVGADDTETWEITEPDVDAGGETRVERITSLHDNWVAHGIDARLDVLPGTGHSGEASIPAVQRFFAEVLA